MDGKNLKYECILDIELIMKVAAKNNILSAPFAEIEGKVLTANELKQYISEYSREGKYE
jgi:hypothetical protein